MRERATVVALVTGASRGIGRAIALRLAVRRAAPVAVNFRADAEGAKETIAAIESAGGRAIFAPGDVSTLEGVDEAFAAAEEAGAVLVLVNNAGTTRDTLAADDEARGLGRGASGRTSPARSSRSKRAIKR